MCNFESTGDVRLLRVAFPRTNKRLRDISERGRRWDPIVDFRLPSLWRKQDRQSMPDLNYMPTNRLPGKLPQSWGIPGVGNAK